VIDQLINRRTALELQTEIPDMKDYSEAWNKLGADFLAVGMENNAAYCFEHWLRYSLCIPS